MSDQPIPREGSDSSLNALANPNNGSEIGSPRSSTESRSSSRNHNQLRVSHMPPHKSSTSPKLERDAPGSSGITALSATAFLEPNVDPAFIGRDWQQISIGELVSPEDLRFVELDTGIEEATNILIDSGTPVLLIRESPEKTSAVATFDYSDLNTYLLLAAGLALPEEHNRASYDELAKKAREGEKIPLKDVKGLGMEKEPLITLPASANVLTAVETFGGGIHRVVVVKESNDQEVVGIFSQFRLVKFLWENGRSFPAIEQLYPQALAQLRIGSHNVISINGDKPLSEALQLMNSEGISSLVVVDNHSNVIGNISTTDVKLLTRSSSLPLLQNTCTHFISVILSTRGLIEGQDSYPVFHVNPTSTLAHTVAKIVATRSHRLWVTDPLSPASSGPPTPSHSTAHIPLATASSTAANSSNIGISPPASPLPPASTAIPAPIQATPHLPTPPHLYANTESTPGATPPLVPSVPAAALPGARLSGRLVGVVSLTDVLNLHARASGLNPADPAEFRRRRRSSSSSMSVRRSGEVGREMFSRGI
ncbi:Protein sds23 [Penicillium manginii]|uniref:Protein sds23 n=1 Tax=Penicillium manginii TaxID=203109 RepID=UPI0025466CC8|nr:Protein sds23 [Penicillium manginii]KAJ5764063.1 Protein sds23 [Penicillium manginii]